MLFLDSNIVLLPHYKSQFVVWADQTGRIKPVRVAQIYKEKNGKVRIRVDPKADFSEYNIEQILNWMRGF